MPLIFDGTLVVIATHLCDCEWQLSFEMLARQTDGNGERRTKKEGERYSERERE